VIKSVSLSGLLCPLFFFSVVCFASDENVKSQLVPAVNSGSPIIKKVSSRLASFGMVETVSRPTITAEIPGVLDEIYVEEGDKVQRGQLLATLDMADYFITEALSKNELLKKEQELAKRIDYFDRIKALSAANNVSEDMVATASRDIAIDRLSVEIMRKHNEISARNVTKGKIESPISGVVTKRFVSTGDYLAVSMPMFVLIDDEKLRVRLKVSPKDINKISIGQRVVIKSPGFSDERINSTIKAIVPIIDPVSNSIDVLASVNNSQLISGMHVEADIYTREEHDALVVPERSVSFKNDQYYVFVIKEGRIREQLVEAGARWDGWLEINTGVSGKEVIVFDAYRGIKDGDLVNDLGAAR
jgi:RND family efflux transporter MFP subunit